MKISYVLIIFNFFLTSAICQTENPPYISLGSSYGGGIVFQIDPTGQHGLIAAPFDQSHGTCWGNEGWINAAYMDNGKPNTEKIVSFLKEKRRLSCETPAAWICDTLTLCGFADWYLPSIDELITMNENRKLIGEFILGFYCSSTESNKANCWSVKFEPKSKCVSFQSSKLEKGYSVRCIRKF